MFVLSTVFLSFFLSLFIYIYIYLYTLYMSFFIVCWPSYSQCWTGWSSCEYSEPTACFSSRKFERVGELVGQKLVSRRITLLAFNPCARHDNQTHSKNGPNKKGRPWQPLGTLFYGLLNHFDVLRAFTATPQSVNIFCTGFCASELYSLEHARHALAPEHSWQK